MQRLRMNVLRLALCLLTVCLMGSHVYGQLQITEILYDSNSAPESNWEWFELYNAGSTDVDLDGYYLDDASTAAARTEPNIVSLVGETVINTIVPAGKTAIVYNASGLDFDASRFRDAWGLSPSQALIGVDGWQALNNGGDAFGLWENFDQYDLDLDNLDEDEDLEVAGFGNAVVSIDYRDGFPGSPAGSSIQWNGSGQFDMGDNWFANEEGSAIVSVATSLDDMPINDTRDVGNPGTVIGDVSDVDSLAITELMYNPASAEPDWEWVEVYNGTNSTIRFDSTPYFLDDSAGGALSEPNVSSGEIPAGEAAVLFRDGITTDDMTAAWGEGNYIAVSGWQSLNNGGDLIALWDDVDDYLADSVEGGRTDIDAVTSVTYLDGDEDWPNVGQGNSISLLDADEDFNLGTNWGLSEENDGDSLFANAVIASQPDHAGGDVATPGVFGDFVAPEFDLDLNDDGVINSGDAPLLCSAVSSGGQDLVEALAAEGFLPGDFDLNGAVEFPDFLTMSGNFNATSQHYGQGDANCDGAVDFSDFLELSGNFGKSIAGSSVAATVPEPAGMLLFLPSVFLLMRLRRRRAFSPTRSA